MQSQSVKLRLKNPVVPMLKLVSSQGQRGDHFEYTAGWYFKEM